MASRYAGRVTRIQRVSWFLVVLVTAAVAAVVVPMAPSWSASSTSLTSDTALALNTATVTIPAGWNVDIAAASQSQPQASRGEVDISIADALWFGSSQRLLGNVADLTFSSPPLIPEVPDGAKGAQREVWTLTSADGDAGDPQRVLVVRQEESVVLVVVRGPADKVALLTDQIDAIAASVSFAGVSLDVDVAS